MSKDSKQEGHTKNGLAKIAAAIALAAPVVIKILSGGKGGSNNG